MGNGINDLPLYLRNPQVPATTANKPNDVEEPTDSGENSAVNDSTPVIEDNDAPKNVDPKIKASEEQKLKLDKILSRWQNGEITMPTEMIDELEQIGINTNYDEKKGQILFNISLYDSDGKNYTKSYKLIFKKPSAQFVEKRLSYITNNPDSVSREKLLELLEYCNIKYTNQGNELTFKLGDRNYTVKFELFENADTYEEKISSIDFKTDQALMEEKAIDKKEFDEIIAKFVGKEYFVPNDLINDLETVFEGKVQISIKNDENGAVIISFEAVFNENGKIYSKPYRLTYKKPDETRKEEILNSIINNKDNYSQSKLEEILEYWGLECSSVVENGASKIEFETKLHKYSFEFNSKGEITNASVTQTEAQKKLEDEKNLQAAITALTDKFENGEITVDALKTELEKLGTVTDFKSETKDNVLTVTCKVNGIVVETSRKVEPPKPRNTAPAKSAELKEYTMKELKELKFADDEIGFTDEEISKLFISTQIDIDIEDGKKIAKGIVSEILDALKSNTAPFNELSTELLDSILINIAGILGAKNPPALAKDENYKESILKLIDKYDDIEDLKNKMINIFNMLNSQQISDDAKNTFKDYRNKWEDSFKTYSLRDVDSNAFIYAVNDLVGSDEDKKQKLLTKILKLYYPERDFIPGEKEDFKSIIIEDKSNKIYESLKNYCLDKNLTKHSNFKVGKSGYISTEYSEFFYGEVESELRRKYAGELIALGLITDKQALMNLFSLALFKTLSDDSIKNKKEISLENLTSKLLKNYYDILKDMKNESTRNYVKNWHTLSLLNGATLKNMNEYYKYGSTYGDDDEIRLTSIKTDEDGNKTEETVIEFEEFEKGSGIIIHVKTKHEEDATSLNSALDNLVNKYLRTYGSYDNGPKILDDEMIVKLFRQAEETAFEKLKKLDELNGVENSEAIYGYDNFGATQTMYQDDNGKVVTVQAILLQVMYEMEKLIMAKLL